MRILGNFYVDSPSYPLLRAMVSYEGVATANGAVTGTTVVDNQLAAEPSYAGLALKVLDGPAAGQVRPVETHVGNTLGVSQPFTDPAGAVQQILAGVRFVVISLAGGGGAPPPVTPSVGLWMFGICDPGMVASATVLVMPNLAGFPDHIFDNEFWVQVIHNTDNPGAAPEREVRRITNYVGATGTFTCDAFTANVEANDLVAVFHESIMSIEVLGFGTLDTSSATVPADSTRTEGDNYFNGCLLMPTEGAVRFQPRRIVDYTGAGGIFQIDPNNPFTAATGLVDYIIIGDQAEFVPAADSIDNITPSDVIGSKADAATPDDMSGLATSSLVRQLKRVLLRMSPDTFTATVQGNADTALDIMLEDLATYFVAAGAAMALQVNGNVARTNLQQALSDFFTAFGCDGANVFNPIIQGAARTDLDAALYNMATYFSALGAAWSVQINGNPARTNLEQVWEDFSAVFGVDGANVFNPTIQGAPRTDLDTALATTATYFAAAGAAMSIQVQGGAARTNLEQALEDYFAVVGCDGANLFNPTVQGVAQTTFDAAFAALATYISAGGAAFSASVNPGGAARTNIEQTLEDLGDVLAGAGIVTFPAAAPPADGVSIAEVIRQIYNDIVAANSGFQEQPDVAVNTTAPNAPAENDVLNLAAAGTRYIVRHLRLKCADPGANTVTVSLYELVNDALTQVDSFHITAANFATYHSLMDMFGVPYLAGDQLQVTVQASAGGPYGITAQYSFATAT